MPTWFKRQGLDLQTMDRSSQEFKNHVARYKRAYPLPKKVSKVTTKIQMQSSLGGGGGQTYFAGASPKKKGKTAAKKTPKKKVKKGSGKLAAFGVMPKGQATLPKAKKKNGAAPKKITTAKYRKMAWDAKERGNWSTAAKYYDSALKEVTAHE
jgi:hypothetical protein